jgi:hypothetical protein
MRITPAADVGSTDVPGAAPRVRHLAREALVLMLFSATTSATLAGCLLLLTNLGRQG